VQSFKKTQKEVKDAVNAYLDLKVRYGLTVDHSDHKFWRNRMLVTVDTWNTLNNHSNPTHILEFMPEKLVKITFWHKFAGHFEYYIQLNYWLADYLDYLEQICNEPREGLWKRFMPNQENMNV